MDISKLNNNQREAVLSDAQYLRIIAGAGSGKTRVLTMRIVYLIEEEDVQPWKILAITFTNKAAREMKERVMNMLSGSGEDVWISTIHSLCVRILRQDIVSLGWPKSFTIIDADDQKAILKEAYKKYDLDAQTFAYSSVLAYISHCKTAEITPERAKAIAGDLYGESQKAEVYAYYVNRLMELKALDFDDLILKTVQLFRSQPAVLVKWQKRFSHILVDEFQDIDRVQYELIRQLTGKENSLLVVGDPDQTIYSWRGAEVQIITRKFAHDFPGAKTVILNENYRSAPAILHAANSVIANNKDRVEKELIAHRQDETKVIHFQADSRDSEADWIASQIQQLHAKGKPYHDMAILYRSNYLSRTLEKSLMDHGMKQNYIIYGGIRFFARAEIKDALCYLRLIDSGDDLAFMRILNVPRRGIGAVSVTKLQNKAEELHLPLLTIAQQKNPLTGSAKKKLDDFVSQVVSWQAELANCSSYSDFLHQVMEESGCLEMYQTSSDPKDSDRIDNLLELEADLKEYQAKNPTAELGDYLQDVPLETDRDVVDPSHGEQDAVQLMTVHSAKGLEFDTVFVSDLSEGIFPNERAMHDAKGVEEERRLAYVAFTRAQNALYLTDAGGFSFATNQALRTSRFVNEIDPQCIEHVSARPVEKKPVERDETIYVRAKQTASVYKKGDIVVHQKFGEGVVINTENNIVTIAFPYPYGVKKIFALFAGMHKKG